MIASSEIKEKERIKKDNLENGGVVSRELVKNKSHPWKLVKNIEARNM